MTGHLPAGDTNQGQWAVLPLSAGPPHLHLTQKWAAVLSHRWPLSVRGAAEAYHRKRRGATIRRASDIRVSAERMSLRGRQGNG